MNLLSTFITLWAVACMFFCYVTVGLLRTAYLGQSWIESTGQFLLAVHSLFTSCSCTSQLLSIECAARAGSLEQVGIPGR